MEYKQAPLFTKLWATMLAISVLLVLLGLTPQQLVNVSIVFGMTLMPFTYYPLLRTAMDKGIMGKRHELGNSIADSR